MLFTATFFFKNSSRYKIWPIKIQVWAEYMGGGLKTWRSFINHAMKTIHVYQDDFVSPTFAVNSINLYYRSSVATYEFHIHTIIQTRNLWLNWGRIWRHLHHTEFLLTPAMMTICHTNKTKGSGILREYPQWSLPNHIYILTSNREKKSNNSKSNIWLNKGRGRPRL